MKAKLLLLFSFVLLVARGWGQSFECGTDYVHNKLMETDSSYRSQILANELEIQKIIQNQTFKKSKKQIYTIPVVVHIIHLGEAIGIASNISDAQVQNTINGLNDRFRNFIGTGFDTEIEFCLAVTDPNYNPTNGINRVDGSGIPNYTAEGIGWDGSCGADKYDIKDLSKWPVLDYYNIWVVDNICGGFAGYASYPYGGAYDGTVIDYNYMIYNSKVLTHEVGHGFYLYHTFQGDDSDGDGIADQCPPNTDCTIDGDKVCDTPPHSRNDGCSGTNTCTGGSLSLVIDNYMSYCWPGSEFTQNQKDRLRATVIVFPRASLLSSNGCIFNSAPIANFTSNVTNTCTGEVQFTDISENGPVSWLWNFGDGNTSTQQNTTYTYTNNGTYTVILIVTNAYGNDTLIQTSYITVSMPFAPTTISASRCGSGSVTLSASGTSILNWYDDSLAGNLVNTGTTYTTPSLSTTTNYYVENVIIYPLQYVGLPDNLTGTGGNHTNTAYYLIFDCFSPFTLLSVKVYATGTGFRTIEFRNSAGTVLQDTTVNLPNGESRIMLNFNITPGTNYQLATSGMSEMYRNNSGVSFPYTLPGIVSITGNNIPDPNYYYYYYDWEIQEPGCKSTRIPVSATIYQKPTATITASNDTTFGTCDGEAIVSANGGTAPYTYQWDAAAGSQITVTATGLCAGIYSVIVTDANGCVDSANITVSEITGVSEFQSSSSKFKVYPNPASGAVNIEFTLNKSKDVSITVTNVIGEIVSISELSARGGSEIYTIDLSEKANGIYYIHIVTNDEVVVRKVSVIK